MMKTRHTFTIIYVAITLLEVTADLIGHNALVYFTKPLILISLIFYALFVPDERNISNRKLFMAGLGFALLGDILLMIREADLFVPGLAAFLVMQIIYCLCFLSDLPKNAMSKALQTKLPFLAMALFLYLLLLPGLSDLTMKIAVAIYAYSIATMAWLALLRKKGVSGKSFKLVFAGALLFMFSDSCIAINKFLIPIPYNTIWVMCTYAAAQYLIVSGYLKTKQAG